MDDARHKFGLPRHWTFLDEDFDERMAATEAFIKDAVEAVLCQVVDRKAAERMFREELDRQTATPQQGRPPEQEVNDELLKQVAHWMESGISKTSAVRTVAAEWATPEENPESVETRIWRGLNRHKKAAELGEEAAKRAEEARRAWAALITFRTAAGEISRCADYESALAEYEKKLAPLLIEEPKPTDV
jgi:hypothetical protein